jgi:hypothetical protein
MPSSGMGRRRGLVRTNVSKEHVASIFKMERISERRKTLAVDHHSVIEINLLEKTSCILPDRNRLEQCQKRSAYAEKPKPHFVEVEE